MHPGEICFPGHQFNSNLAQNIPASHGVSFRPYSSCGPIEFFVYGHWSVPAVDDALVGRYPEQEKDHQSIRVIVRAIFDASHFVEVLILTRILYLILD